MKMNEGDNSRGGWKRIWKLKTKQIFIFPQQDNRKSLVNIQPGNEVETEEKSVAAFH